MTLFECFWWYYFMTFKMSQLETTEFLLLLLFVCLFSFDMQQRLTVCCGVAAIVSHGDTRTTHPNLPLTMSTSDRGLLFTGFRTCLRWTQAWAARGDRDAPAWPVWVSQLNGFFFFFFFFSFVPGLASTSNACCAFSLYSLFFFFFRSVCYWV